MIIFIFCLDKSQEEYEKKENIEIKIKEENEPELIDASANDEKLAQRLTASDITKEFLPKFQVFDFLYHFHFQFYQKIR